MPIPVKLQSRNLDMSSLPPELMSVIKEGYLSPSDTTNLMTTAKKIHSFFEGQHTILNKLLQMVAYGQQDKVESLFNEVFHGQIDKIQQALLHRAQFTDYSGRSFNCSAYEYTYWSKDSYMARMLEKYMAIDTKAHLMERIAMIEEHGLFFQQHGLAHRSTHFDFNPLIQALELYIDHYNLWSETNNNVEMQRAWIAVGKAQRDVPVHVAQEYCRRDRLFNAHQTFDEPIFKRKLNFYDWDLSRVSSWFPLTCGERGLGINFGLVRWNTNSFGLNFALSATSPHGEIVQQNLAAIIHLSKVRTTELEVSFANLGDKTVGSFISALSS